MSRLDSALKKLAAKIVASGTTITGDTVDEVIDCMAENLEILPAVTAEDNGKMLKVVEGKWTAVTDALPAVTAEDNNKILKVVDGVWTAASAG